MIFEMVTLSFAFASVVLAMLVVLDLFGSKPKASEQMTFFKISVPHDYPQSVHPGKLIQELATATSTVGWNKFIFGEPYISCDLIAHRQSMILIIGLPKASAINGEKIILSHFPSAKKINYSMSPSKLSASGYLTERSNQAFYFDIQKVDTFASSLNEGESAIAQFLISPARLSEENKASTIIRLAIRADNPMRIQKVMQDWHRVIDRNGNFKLIINNKHTSALASHRFENKVAMPMRIESVASLCRFR